MGLFFDAFGLGKTTKTVIKYAITDQEKEGREAGIILAAEIYKPVVKRLESECDNIVNMIKKYRDRNETKLENIYQLAEDLRRNDESICIKINKIKSNRSDLEVFLKEFMLNDCILGTISLLPVFRSNYLISSMLHNKMKKKYKKYREIEFQKEQKVWLNKIEEIKGEMLDIVEEFSKLEKERQQLEDELAKVLNLTTENYAEHLKQLAILEVVQ